MDLLITLNGSFINQCIHDSKHYIKPYKLSQMLCVNKKVDKGVGDILGG